MIRIEKYDALEAIKTPFYYYDMARLDRTLAVAKELSDKYGIELHYAIKANAEARVLAAVQSYGFGADCVSGPEVELSLKSGFPAEKVLFAGVGKTDDEIRFAVNAGIAALNVESLEELEVIDAIAAELGKKARVALRVNPNIDAHTHQYVTTGLEDNKFGVSDYQFEDAVKLFKSLKNIEFTGLHFHIGSQITAIDEVYALECRRAGKIAAWFEEHGLPVESVDLGGGLGVNYELPDDDDVPDFEKWFMTIATHLKVREGVKVRVEPGRAMVAQCGNVITRALFVKKTRTKEFLILDAGMNDLIRPALYGSYHKIENISASAESDVATYDVVGPVCESSDVWGKGRVLPVSKRGDLIAIRTAGAYGQVMASRYNQRPLAVAVYSDEL